MFSPFDSRLITLRFFSWFIQLILSYISNRGSECEGDLKRKRAHHTIGTITVSPVAAVWKSDYSKVLSLLYSHSPTTMVPEVSAASPDDQKQHERSEAQEERKSVNDYRHHGIPVESVHSPAINAMERARKRLFNIVDGPVTWLKESVIGPIQQRNKQVYYHRKYPRVPTIDECEEGDLPCYMEAEYQMRRDREVDGQIVNKLRGRQSECFLYEGEDWAKNCVEVMEDYTQGQTNFYMRYGEVGHFGTVVDLYMKQKHRMIWERRNPDKVDFMYAKDRVGKKYIVQVDPGLLQSVQLPDASRMKYHRTKPSGTGGVLVEAPEDNPQQRNPYTDNRKKPLLGFIQQLPRPEWGQNPPHTKTEEE